MSVSSDSMVVLTRAQVKAIIKQSRAVDENKQRPSLHAIYIVTGKRTIGRAHV